MALTNPSTITQTQIPNWQWQTWQGLAYLRCNLLENWQHGFFTRHFFPSSPSILTKAFTETASINQLNQIHSNKVVKPSEKISENMNDADGLISETGNQALWVASADCTPILIGDRQTRQVSAIHAGWRGTAQGIVKEAVRLLISDGSKISDLLIAMGPAISGSVYQVSETVAATICQSILGDESPQNTSEILNIAWQLPQTPLREDNQVGRVKIDVTQVNYLQLQQLEIKPAQIAIAPYCTYQNPDLFFSYRRSKEKKVQWSGIVS